MRALFLTLTLIGIFFLRSAHCGDDAVTPEETKKQGDFREKYRTALSTDQRMAAVKLLDGCHHSSTTKLLQSVVETETRKEIRIAAFEMLCTYPAHDLTLEQLLIALFNRSKPTDLDERMAYARATKGLEFKCAIYDVIADVVSRMRYPDLLSGVVVAAGHVDPNVALQKQRDEFAAFLAVFNDLTGATLKATNKSSPLEVKLWWEENRAAYLDKEKTAAQKYIAEEKTKRESDWALKKQANAPKTDAPKPDAAKTDAPKPDATKPDAPKADPTKADPPKTDPAH